MVGVERAPGWGPEKAGPQDFCHLRLPFKSMAKRIRSSSTFPVVYIRPLAIETVEKPSPRPSRDQSSGGPSGGHDFKRLVSVDLAFRLGPCHWGQPGELTAMQDWPRNIDTAKMHNGSEKICSD